MLSLEAYRVTIGVFYVNLQHCVRTKKSKYENVKNTNMKNTNNSISSSFCLIKFQMVICTAALVVLLNLHYSKTMAGNLTREGVESNPELLPLKSQCKHPITKVTADII